MKRKNKPKVVQKNNSQFTPDQLRQIFFAHCLDRDHLYEWIKLFWGVNLPGTTVSRYSTSNPLESVWDVYNHCVHLKKGMDTLYIAPRGGGKTLGVAITESALMFHDKRGVVHVGAIEKQSKRAYQYFQNFISKNKDVLGPLIEKDTIEKTVIIVDNEQVSLECLPCTMAALNGPHEACENPNSIVELKDGRLIKVSEVKPGDWIRSYDVNNLSHCFKIVEEVKSTSQPTWELSFSDKTVYSAASFHMILTKQGWATTGSLGIGQSIAYMPNSGISSDLLYNQNEAKTNNESMLIGIMLGDGCLSTRKYSVDRDNAGEYYGNPALVITHGLKQAEYLKHICSRYPDLKLNEEVITTSFGGKTVSARTGHTDTLLWLKQLFIDSSGKKRISDELIQKIDAEAIAYWFMDDGSMLQGGTTEFSTHSFSKEECEKLVTALANNGIKAEIFKYERNEKTFWVIRCNSRETVKLTHLIAPYIHRSMAYKLQNKRSNYFSFKEGLPITGSNSGWARGLPQFKELNWKTIEKVEFKGVQDVIAIKVAAERFEDASYICNSVISHNCIVMDELDTLSPEGRLAYKQINGIPVKHRLNGAPPVKIGISTRKSAYGLVQQQMDSAESQGRKVKMWNQIDLMERCEPSRYGKGNITIYVDQERMKHIPQEEFDKLADSKKADFVAYPATDGCLKCPLFSVCLGDAKNQDPKMTAASSTMIATIDEVATKVKSADADWVMAELMCMKPSVEGIVFKEFDKTRHVVDFNYMWKVLTKEVPTEDIDEHKFVQELHKRKIPIYAGIDWGWSAPSTLTVAAVDQEDNVYVLRSFGITKTNDPTFIHMIKTKYHRFYKIQMYYPDNANGSGVDLMKSAGLPVAPKIDKSENLGVQVIKRCLNIPGTSETKLMIAKDYCDQLVNEMERFHYETDAAGNSIDGRFAKEFDHAIDGLRYMLVAIMGKARFVISHDIGNAGNEEPLLATDGSYLRAPNFHELARMHNVPINAPESRPFNKSDDDEDNGPDGFNWGF